MNQNKILLVSFFDRYLFHFECSSVLCVGMLAKSYFYKFCKYSGAKAIWAGCDEIKVLEEETFCLFFIITTVGVRTTVHQTNNQQRTPFWKQNTHYRLYFWVPYLEIPLKYGFHKKSFIFNATLVSCPFPSSLLGGCNSKPTQR